MRVIEILILKPLLFSFLDSWNYLTDKELEICQLQSIVIPKPICEISVNAPV